MSQRFVYEYFWQLFLAGKDALETLATGYAITIVALLVFLYLIEGGKR